MQFFWPIKAEYRIIYLADDDMQTVIGRTKRNHVWIMTRNRAIPEDDDKHILDFLIEPGYNLSKLRKVPHRSG